MKDTDRMTCIPPELLHSMEKLKGKTVVIKYGGKLAASSRLRKTAIDDIILLKHAGINPVVVHGGGPDINSFLAKQGIKSTFYKGLRITSLETLEAVQMVLVGKTNKEIVSLINLRGGRAIGLCGIDGNMIQCVRLGKDLSGNDIDLGYVGSIVSVDTEPLEIILAGNYIPVIAPIGIGTDGESYNINADTAAGKLASALKAEKLVLLTDVRGIKKTPKSHEIFSEIPADYAYRLIKDEIISEGMIPKVISSVDALNNGVPCVHITDGNAPHCILHEMFTGQRTGTMITP